MIAQLDLFQSTAARDRAVAKVARSTRPECHARPVAVWEGAQ